MFDLYYNETKDELGVNIRDNLLQFSDEPNMFYVLTDKWEFVSKIEFPTTKDQWEEIDEQRKLEKALRNTEQLPDDNFGQEEATKEDLPDLDSFKSWN